jgi:hypothetical protein
MCPECNHKVDVGEDPDIGLHLYCETCLADLVVAWLNPIELIIVGIDDYAQFDGDPFSENFQKIRKKETIMPSGKPKKSTKKTTGTKKTPKK